MAAVLTMATVQTVERRRVRTAYVPVVVCGRLAFRYDPARRVVEWQQRGETHYIDLAALDDAAGQVEPGTGPQDGD